MMENRMMHRLRFGALGLIFCAMGGCGVYSQLRPADTLDAGTVEVSGGFSANHYGEGQLVGQAAVGVTDRWELYGHYETRTGWAGTRFALLRSETSPVAVSMGFQLGSITRMENLGSFLDTEYHDTFAYGPSLTIGRRFKDVEPYLGYMAFFGGDRFEVGSARLGLRVHMSPHFVLGVELGSAQHNTRQVGVAATFEGAGYATFVIPMGGAKKPKEKAAPPVPARTEPKPAKKPSVS